MSRKSFIIHKDSLDILDELTNEQAGELFKAIKAHQLNDDFTMSALVKIAFSPFKNQFARDDEKYTKTCERRAVAGSKGGKQKVANASKRKQEVSNVADSVSKNKNDSKSDSDNKAKDITSLSPKADPIPYQKIIDLYHQTLPDLPRVAKLTPKRKGQIRQRFTEDMKALDNWENFFDHVKQSDFLMGRIQPINGRSVFRADIEWLTNQTNFTKIAEGKYHV